MFLFCQAVNAQNFALNYPTDKKWQVDQVKLDPKEKKKEENIWLPEEKKGGTGYSTWWYWVKTGNEKKVMTDKRTNKQDFFL